jgi:hypothetical protein
MARQRRSIFIALVIFIVLAAVIRFFGSPLYDMLLSLHGRPAGH